MTQRCAVLCLLKEHRCLHLMSPWAFTWSTDIDMMMMAMASRVHVWLFALDTNLYCSKSTPICVMTPIYMHLL